MDFGRKFMNRIFIYASTFLGCYLAFAIILLLEFFGFLKLNISLCSKIIAIFDITVIMIITLLMFYCGAVVNE